MKRDWRGNKNRKKIGETKRKERREGDEEKKKGINEGEINLWQEVVGEKREERKEMS